MVTRTNYLAPNRNKDGVLTGYPDAVRVEYDDYIQLYLSMQWAGSRGGEVPADVKEQTRLTLENIREIIEANGGTIRDVTRVHVYVLDFSQERLLRIHEARAQFFAGGQAPTSTLVEVPGLPFPGANIAIEAEAVIVKGQ